MHTEPRKAPKRKQTNKTQNDTIIFVLWCRHFQIHVINKVQDSCTDSAYQRLIPRIITMTWQLCLRSFHSIFTIKKPKKENKKTNMKFKFIHSYPMGSKQFVAGFWNKNCTRVLNRIKLCSSGIRAELWEVNLSDWACKRPNDMQYKTKVCRQSIFPFSFCLSL